MFFIAAPKPFELSLVRLVVFVASDSDQYIVLARYYWGGGMA